MIKVCCKAERKLFPPDKESELEFMLCSYIADDISVLPTDAQSTRFIAKGNLLPYSTASSITLYGDRWESNQGEYTLNCVGYEETIPNTVQSVSRFFETLDGCDPTTITKIINEAPDDNPALAVYDGGQIIRKAIKNEFFADKITRGCELRTSKRPIFFYALPFLPKGCNPQLAADLALSAADLEDVKNNAFRFSIDNVIPYRMACSIAKANNIPKDSPQGVQAALIDALMQGEGKSTSRSSEESETAGNTFTEIGELFKRAGNALGIDKHSPLLRTALDALIARGLCLCEEGKFVYRTCTAEAEYGIARELLRVMDHTVQQRDYKLDIYGLENKKRMRLAPEQRRAVKIALNNTVTLLIGGPGTGKTSIEKFIIEIFQAYSESPVLLVAPTGKAARRMEESTGMPACTIHKALDVTAGAEVLISDKILDAGLIMIDEASMVDAQTAYALFKAIKQGTQVVIVGDTNQLPSVGSGNVLYELIQSNAIPIAALETVYRQKAGSTIAVNCARIKRGVEELEYSDTFIFEVATTQEEAAEKVMAAYQAEMAAGVGIEDICLLSPYRRSTATGVNQLNERLQSLLVGDKQDFFTYGKRKFYLGDKVMLMANRDGCANGDVGYITALDIQKKSFDVDYGDGRIVSYKKSALKHFDLAYGITIHKSQGAGATRS